MPWLLLHGTPLAPEIWDGVIPLLDGAAAARSDIDDTLRRWFSPAELDYDGAAVRSARRALATADLVTWAVALRAIAAFDCSAAAPSIRCRAVVVSAEHDPVSDPATMETMHRRLARSEFEVLPDAWHMSVFTDLNRLVDLLNR